MTTPIEDLLAQVPASSGSAALEALDPETREILGEFAEWLQTSDPAGTKTEATARAYKAYVASALAAMDAGKSWDDLSTDVRSGVKAFRRFVATEVAKATPEDSDAAFEDAAQA